MKVLTVNAGENDVFLRLLGPQGQEKAYPIVTSAKKISAQMGKPETDPKLLQRLKRQ